MRIGVESNYNLERYDDVEIVNGDVKTLLQMYKAREIESVCLLGDTREAYIQSMKILGLVWKKAFIVSPLSVNGTFKLIGDIGANPTMDHED